MAKRAWTAGRAGVAGVVGVLALLPLAVGCPSEDACIGGSSASRGRYEDCLALCGKGNSDACDRRAELEAKLGTACFKRSSKSACRALCHGRLHHDQACQKLRVLP